MSRKKEDLLPLVAQKLVVQAGLINTAISSIADILHLLRDILPKCAQVGCISISVGTHEGQEVCHHCGLGFLSKGEHVEWKRNKEAILRVEDSVTSLLVAGYIDPGDMH